MALTRTKSGLYFIGPGAKVGDSNDPQEDTKSVKGSSEDAKVNTKDVEEDMPEDDPQDKVVDGDIGENNQLDESYLVVIMARQLHWPKAVQAPPITDAPEKADSKDPRALGIHKDKGKGIKRKGNQALSTSGIRCQWQKPFHEQSLKKIQHQEGKSQSYKRKTLGNNLRNHINDRVHVRESSSDKTQCLELKVEELMKIMEKISGKQSVVVSNFEEEDTEPCVKRIIDAPLLENFRMPQIELYEGRTDPRDHLSKYNRIMQVAQASDNAKSLCFLMMLSKSTEDWWKRLSPGSIHNWRDLQVMFRKKFIAAKDYDLEARSLTSVKQKKGEILKKFILRMMDVTAKTKSLTT
uniref:Retrotransposon gag domain-containing protein n=1 Tax=Cannabis sativa TaxID=3483 RepID=A0A803PI49_CANSA